MTRKTLVFVLFVALIWIPVKAAARAPAQKPKPKVDITFNSQVVTGKTVPIMVGQEAKIGYAGASIARHQWLVPWNVVGGYKPTLQFAGVSPAKFAVDTLDVYWIDPGAKTVWLLYDLSGGGQGRVSVTFNVQGPTKVTVTTQTGIVKLFKTASGQEVGLGEGTKKSVGIIFTASPPASGSGQYKWVQLINSDEFYYTHFDGTHSTQKSTGGLDYEAPPPPAPGAPPPPPPGPDAYVNATGPKANDSPGEGLYILKNTSEDSRQFTATMYLMWQADAPNSIPVPLGYVVWYLGWNLVNDPSTAKSKGGWRIVGGFVKPTPFQASLKFPEWDGVSTLKN